MKQDRVVSTAIHTTNNTPFVFTRRSNVVLLRLQGFVVTGEIPFSSYKINPLNDKRLLQNFDQVTFKKLFIIDWRYSTDVIFKCNSWNSVQS